MNLSFAGCGFLGIYHVGVASCLGEYAPQLWADQKIFGASAGALAACGLITRCDLGKATTYVLRVATEARKRALGPLHPSFCLVKYLREGLHAFLPDNAHEISSNRLFVSLTRVSDRKNVLVSQFDSKEDLIEALICSAFVPFYCGIIPPKYHGVRYVDGGCTDNLPVVDGDTITVSAFAGESDICPTDNSANFLHFTIANTSIQLTAANLYRFSHALFPPHPEVLTNMCQQGFDDALKYLQRNDLITCTQHLSMHSKILSTDLVDMTLPDDMVTEETDVIAEKEEEEIEEEDVEEDEEEEDTDDKTEMCALCRERQHVALIDSLPQPVISALQESCDSVNKGLLAPLYKMRLFKVLSLMAAPWILPFDIVLLLSKRFYEWAPYMPSDMQWFVNEFRAVIRAIVDLIQTGRHRYSARFSCQLAITELGYGKEEEAQMLQDRPGHGACSHEALHLKRRALNVGFSVDFKSRAQSPIHSVNEIRQHILDDEDHGHVTLEKLPTPTEYDVTEIEEFGTPRIQRSRSNSVTNVSYDTFENCLHIANQMDSLLSFYYQEEDNPNIINVTEIFPLSDPQSPKPDFDLGEYSRDTPGENSPSTSTGAFKCPLERRCSGSFTLPTHFEET